MTNVLQVAGGSPMKVLLAAAAVVAAHALALTISSRPTRSP